MDGKSSFRSCNNGSTVSEISPCDLTQQSRAWFKKDGGLKTVGHIPSHENWRTAQEPNTPSYLRISEKPWTGLFKREQNIRNSPERRAGLWRPRQPSAPPGRRANRARTEPSGDLKITKTKVNVHPDKVLLHHNNKVFQTLYFLQALNKQSCKQVCVNRNATYNPDSHLGLTFCTTHRT